MCAASRSIASVASAATSERGTEQILIEGYDEMDIAALIEHLEKLTEEELRR